MRIGLVQSWYEMMPLFQILQAYDHEYHIFCDWKHWPWWEKSEELRNQELNKAVAYLIETAQVEKVILPPTCETWIVVEKYQSYVLPLFSTYVLEHVLSRSLVWKLWILCEEVDMERAESLIHDLTKKYILSENQSNIRKFHTEFPVWKKNIRMWTYFLTTFWKKDWMMRKTIKHDLSYFKDAAVDSLIPLTWWCLFYETPIHSKMNWKKIKFHGKEAVASAFESLVTTTWTYTISLHYTDYPKPLLEERKWSDVLTRGGKVEMKMHQV